MNIKILSLVAMIFSQAHAAENQINEINLTEMPTTFQIKDLSLRFAPPESKSQICRSKVCVYEIFLNKIKIASTMLNHSMNISYYEDKSGLYINISNHSVGYFGDIFISVCQKTQKSCECALSREASEIARRKDFPEIDTGTQTINLDDKRCAYSATKTQWR